MSNKLTKIAKEILEIESDIRLRFDYSKGERPTAVDFELFTFEQTWSSTALGFGGIGGCAMTTANTYVLVPVTCNQPCLVYFAGRFAYKADYSEALRQDLANRCLVSVANCNKYNIKE